MEADRKAIEADIANIDRSQAALSNQRLKLMATVELQYVEEDYHRRVLGERTGWFGQRIEMGKVRR
jgi:hypothetical protein